jgi:hypothetical protein
MWAISPALKTALEAELKAIDKVVAEASAKRDAIMELIETDQKEAVRRQSQHSTIEMARLVIRNAGRPLSPDKIQTNIHTTFGIVPAKTLYDMLLKRARKPGSGFFRDAEGQIGLSEMQPTITTVARIEGFSKTA